MRQGFHNLRFPAALEQRFEQDSAPQRLRFFVLSSVVVGLLYSAFLISDWFMIPDVFGLALLVRLGIFMPMCLCGAWVMPRIQHPYLREILVALAGAAAASAHMIVQSASLSPLAPYYPVGLAVLITYCNVVQRIRFYLALALSLAILAGYFVELLILPPLPLVVTAPVVLLLLSTIVFTLYTNYLLEYEERQNYLLRLREEQVFTALAEANARLIELSGCDALTGIANRRSLEDTLAKLWTRARRDGAELSALMIDVDFFKLYNDRHGHPAGDDCLRRVAAAIRHALRESQDFLARFGGEEFIAVLPATSILAAEQAGERVRQAVVDLGLEHQTPLDMGIVTVSVGAASMRASDEHASPEALIAAADRALYRAKSAGRNRVSREGA